MFTLKVKNNRDEVLNLTGNKNYNVYKIIGLNPPQANINASVNTTTDGSRINAIRLENRNIVLYISIEGDIEKNRIELYKYFPIKKTVTLYFTNGIRNVFIEGTVEVIECDLFSNRQFAQISLICAKPYFKQAKELITTFSDIVPLFEFPFEIEEEGIEFSVIQLNQRKTIINSGDVDTGTIIELFATGTVVNPIIYNTQTAEHLALNFTMQPSDKIVINTNVGEKSITLVRGGISTNAMGYMTPDSVWFSLKNGDNVFTYNADEGTYNLQITFTTNLLFSGV